MSGVSTFYKVISFSKVFGDQRNISRMKPTNMKLLCSDKETELEDPLSAEEFHCFSEGFLDNPLSKVAVQ